MQNDKSEIAPQLPAQESMAVPTLAPPLDQAQVGGPAKQPLRFLPNFVAVPLKWFNAKLGGWMAPGTQLRLWPGLVIVALQWLVVASAGRIAPGTMAQFMAMFLAPMVSAVALVVWWLLFSRLRWADRFLGIFGCIATGGVAFACYDSTFGMFGMLLYALPVVTTAWVVWLLVGALLPWRVRRVGLLVVFALCWGRYALYRFDGATGSMAGELSYRWLPTNEEKFNAEVAAGKLGVARGVDAAGAKPLVLQPGDWPGFRGPGRDGRLTGVRIATDWDKNPPKELWRHRVGPGWGSFAVVGTHLFTQEQRGEDEVVVCYDADTGSEIWAHRDSARFTEAVAGVGPRATPTFHEGKLYTLGAAGRFNCLDAATGGLLWSRDVVADTGAKVPQWGFAASPLVAQGVVTIFAGGPDGNSVVGYDATSGEKVWSAGQGQMSYCSPQPAQLDGVDQLVIATEKGLTGFQPKTGEILWLYPWELDNMVRVVQPTIVDGADVLLGTGFGLGLRRVHIDREGNTWAAKEVWATRAISPYFNDLVVHRGHLYGFTPLEFFTCVSLADGKSKWRERGYGNGQVLLLADQDLLLVLSEEGNVALVETNPVEHKELAQFSALQGKTWNHPVVAHGKLFVRNGAEAACYQLTETNLDASPRTD